jgi:hypothetical protein
MRFIIEPAPSQDEAAAIEAAFKTIAARRSPAPPRLRYADVWSALKSRPDTVFEVATTWSDAARLESIDSGV